MANKKKPKKTVPESAKPKSADAAIRAFEGLLAAPAYTDPAASFQATQAALELPTVETPVTQEQWERIYEVIKSIRLLEPWKYFHESERIALLLPGRDEPVYIVVMGSGDMTYGIGIYPGYDSLQRLYKMEDNPIEDDMSVAFEQHCIILYYGDREELESKDRAVIKDLGLKFRGRNEWPYLRSMKPGYLSWYINSDEAELVIAALQNFAMAALFYVKQQLKVDFRGGETLLRFYDEDSKMWCNAAIKMPPEPFMALKLAVDNDELVSRLNKQKKTKAKLAFGLTYIPAPIQESKNQRPKLPRLAVLLDISKGKVKPIAHALNDGSEFIGKTITTLLTEYIEKNGRPLSVSVNDEDNGLLLADLLEKLDIKLIEDENLSVMSNIIMHILDAVGGSAFLG